MHVHAGTETAPGPSGEGTVVLDIGGTSGAAVVYVPASLDGEELEIRPVGRPWDGTHTAVRRRDLRDGVCFAGVFGTLQAGGYEVRVRGTGSAPVLALEVTGAGITEVHWPAG